MSLDDYEDRVGPMTIVNVQLSPAGDGEPVFVNVGKVQGGAFALDFGATVIFPGGTLDVPADQARPLAQNGALAAGPSRALPVVLGLALSWVGSAYSWG